MIRSHLAIRFHRIRHSLRLCVEQRKIVKLLVLANRQLPPRPDRLLIVACALAQLGLLQSETDSNCAAYAYCLS